MRIFGWNEFWICLKIFSLKWWRNPAKKCFEIALQCFRWSDEGIRLTQVFRLSQNILVEVMRNFGSNKFWNCLTIFSLNWWRNPNKTCFESALQCFSLKPWGDSAETSIEIVLEYFRWSDEEIRLKQVLNLSAIFSLKWWRNRVKTCFEIVLQCSRWSDEELRLKQVLKFSHNIFVEKMKNAG